MKIYQKSKLKLIMIISIVIIAAFTLFMTACGEETREFRLGHVCQVEHPYNYAAQHFADLVEERTDGRIKIIIYPARQLGGDRDLIENVQSGALDMAVASTCVFGGFTPLLDALQLPFLIDSYNLLDRAVVTDEAKALLEGLEKIDIKAFAIWDAGLRHLVFKKGLIKSLEDLRGAKIRVSEAPLLMDIFKALGASPTPLPYGEIYTALQLGTIDGIEMDLSAIYVERDYEQAKYVTLTSHYPWPMVPIMNLELFNSLSEEDRDIIAEAAWETISFNHQNVRELDEKYLGLLKEAGVNFGYIDDLTPFKEATQVVYETYTAKDSRIKDFVDAVLAIKESKIGE